MADESVPTASTDAPLVDPANLPADLPASEGKEEGEKTEAIVQAPIEAPKNDEKGSSVVVAAAASSSSSKSREEELDILIVRIRDAIDLPGFTTDKWTREHDTLVREFFSHPTERVLTMAVVEEAGLKCSFGIKDFSRY